MKLSTVPKIVTPMLKIGATNPWIIHMILAYMVSKRSSSRMILSCRTGRLHGMKNTLVLKAWIEPVEDVPKGFEMTLNCKLQNERFADLLTIYACGASIGEKTMTWKKQLKGDLPEIHELIKRISFSLYSKQTGRRNILLMCNSSMFVLLITSLRYLSW